MDNEALVTKGFENEYNEQWVLGKGNDTLYITGSDIGWQTITVEVSKLSVLDNPFTHINFSASELEWIKTTMYEWK